MCPAGLNDAARSEFLRVARLLAAAGHLRPEYIDALTEYALVTVRLREIRAALVVHGEVFEVEGRYGRQVKLHPLTREMNECTRQWRSLAVELGLTPRSAQRLPDVGYVADPDDAANEFYTVV
jgi:P27 family predicted phage terminase small subunit